MSLQVAAGDVVVVVGENGSGKTTLLKILAGLEVADRGEVRMLGRIGYCPQSLELY
ncbi:MAG: ATP-binding cassette domain-containing protein [Dehalococcoidia bacterium]|nr:ATP-binding cassette domain-containing protein [Dehalococcoidia bacterium]